MNPKRFKNIIIYSAASRKGCEKTDLALVNEMISRGYNVTYAVTSNEMFLNKKFDFYSFPESLKQDRDFQRCKTVWIKYFNDLKRIISFLLLFGKAFLNSEGKETLPFLSILFEN